MKKVLQKEIYWADLNPTKGSEQSGKRPVVIISGETVNTNLPVHIVCPLSSKVKHYNSCVFVPKDTKNKLKADSEVITFQVRTISKNRIGKKIGTISDIQLREILTKIGHLFIH